MMSNAISTTSAVAPSLKVDTTTNLTAKSTITSPATIMKDLRAIEEEFPTISNQQEKSDPTPTTSTSTSNTQQQQQSRAIIVKPRKKHSDAAKSTSSAIPQQKNSELSNHRRTKSDELFQLSNDALNALTKNQNQSESQVVYRSNDPELEEQILFDQRLCEDTLGVAVRKINSNGKSQLRYVKCIALEEGSVCTSDKSHFSFGKIGRKKTGVGGYDTDQVETQSMSLLSHSLTKRTRALTWGNKNKVRIHLSSFVCVRKGKTTERTKKNPAPASHLLSLVTSDKDHPSLDLEAPTRLDRDKFARAFARFLDVPLEIEHHQEKTLASRTVVQQEVKEKKDSSRRILSAAKTEPGIGQKQNSEKINFHKEALLVNTAQPKKEVISAAAMKRIHAKEGEEQPKPIIDLVPMLPATTPTKSTPLPSKPKANHKSKNLDSSGDDLSSVSSLTAGFDHEIVEELHQVIHELRTELESSRAEAARAVKVAEQAIQSAESCSSKDWNSTVTHKAAEAAAQAQKRSAEAMARQRFAEEKLASERKSAAFWRKQAEKAEEEAGVLHTRAAVSEVQRSYLEEKLNSEQRIWEGYIHNLQKQHNNEEGKFALQLLEMQSRQAELDVEVQLKQREILQKEEEVKVLRDAFMERINNNQSFMRKRKNGISKIFGRKRANTDDLSTSTPPLGQNRSRTTSHDISVAQHYQFQQKLISLYKDIRQMKIQYAAFRSSVIAQVEAFQLPIAPFLQLLSSSQDEVNFLRTKLAQENAMRRRLSQDVQDLRGTVRVYCRPRPPTDGQSVLQISSPQMLTVHRNSTSTRCYEFDRVLPHSTNQAQLYDEMEELVLGSLDGYSICILAYGQRESGKSYAISGNHTRHLQNKSGGVMFQTFEQFLSISNRRKQRYNDLFSLTILEVNGDRLLDYTAGTKTAATCGQIHDYTKNAPQDKTDDKSNHKLEIRTNYDGNTVVQGLISIPIKSMEDIITLWSECQQQKLSSSSSHLMITITSTSTNLATGVTTKGNLVLVDLAASDVLLKRSGSANSVSSTSKHLDVSSILSPITPTTSNMEYKFVNKSLSTLCDVVVARTHYARNVPYRNSTLTHLLRDYLEGDAKVLLLVCISSDAKDLQETCIALKFASKMRQIEIGRATKHIVSSP